MSLLLVLSCCELLSWMLNVLTSCGFVSFVLCSGHFVGHVFVNLDNLIQVCCVDLSSTFEGSGLAMCWRGCVMWSIGL